MSMVQNGLSSDFAVETNFNCSQTLPWIDEVVPKPCLNKPSEKFKNEYLNYSKIQNILDLKANMSSFF